MGYPHPDLAWGATPSLAGRYHHRGVPPSWPGTSQWDIPQKGHGTSGSIMGWRSRWGTIAPWVWTDWKHNLQSYYALGKNKRCQSHAKTAELFPSEAISGEMPIFSVKSQFFRNVFLPDCSSVAYLTILSHHKNVWAKGMCRSKGFF